VVLAGHFDQHAVPRWADEGIATLSEPPERLEKYRRALSQLARTGQLFTLRELLTLEQYPDRRRIDVFYAQSVSLVEFLTQQRDATTLTAFVRDGLRQGYEASLQKHYGWNLDELQMRWQQRVLGEGRGAQNAQR